MARVGAKVDEGGAITVPARTLQDFINTLPPERVDLTLDSKTNTLKVACGSTISNIRGISADDYPPVPEADAETGMVVPAAAFHEMINDRRFGTL